MDRRGVRRLDYGSARRGALRRVVELWLEAGGGAGAGPARCYREGAGGCSSRRPQW